jgi:hypothetical protein
METNLHIFNALLTHIDKMCFEESLHNFNINLYIFLFGNPDIPDTDNATIFKYVHICISKTTRFL